MDWVSIKTARPIPGSRVLAFTPDNQSLRYRVVDEDLLRTISQATHWCYLTPPDDYYPSSQKTRDE